MFPFSLIRTDSAARIALVKGTSELSVCKLIFRIPVIYYCVFVQGADLQTILKPFDKRVRRVGNTTAMCIITSHDFITSGVQQFHTGASSSF